MKAMCPSAYTYPYDDMSSTFTCTNAGGGNTAENSVDYDVTFCPGNTRVVAANLR
ncbi:hypothetical protein DFJ73DRAFT_845858 [Zopfochytrium polystomum]|nr:hypothetical protein DFJ73DRAFT_845858 [Zopfochytrium polystomum]